MSKGSGTWLSGIAALSVLLATHAGAQGGRFADYVDEENPTPQEKYEEYVMLDVKEKNLRDVLRAISDKVGVNIIPDPNVDENVTVTLDRVEWRNALKVIARQTNCKIIHESDRLIRFTQPPTISMEFQDADLKIVLDLIAKQSGANIVVAEDVKGSVSLSLREVPWEDALNTVVKTAGYAIVEDVLPSTGTKILRVVTRSSLVQQLESCFIRLKYVRPDSKYQAIMTGVHTLAISEHLDADGRGRPPALEEEEREEFSLKVALQQLLSENGSIQYDRVTNSFYVKDIKPRIDEIRKIVMEIDQKPPQVHVKVKFITTANIDLLEKGMRFADPTTGESTGTFAAIKGANPQPQFLLPPMRDAANNPVPGFVADDLLFWGGTFPFDAGHWGEPVGGFHTLGILDFTRAEVLISLIESDENSRVIQAPELTTLNGRSATIFVGESIPFAEQSVNVDQNGNVTVSLQENERSPVNIGFTLYMTPHVIPDTDEVDLCVIPKISNLTGKSSELEGFERFVFGDSFIDLPREGAQTVVTSMRVEQGHTAVIGGLQTETRTDVTTRVPILSSIPILGHLFTYHRENTKIQSVLILITPTIISDVTQAREITQQALRRLQKVDFFHKKGIEEHGDVEE